MKLKKGFDISHYSSKYLTHTYLLRNTFLLRQLEGNENGELAVGLVCRVWLDSSVVFEELNSINIVCVLFNKISVL